MYRASIIDTAFYLPEKKVTNDYITEKVNLPHLLSSSMLSTILGSKDRYFASANEQASDLAVKAALQILSRHSLEEIDLLIFASACSDLIEPATSNIVQVKLGLKCPVFDIKNACNSFLNAIQVADGFISSGIHKRILIVCGEKPSDCIKFNPSDVDDFKKRFASYSFGDAGVAMLIGQSQNDEGFCYHKFFTLGSGWELCQVPGGGSMHPHRADLNYFEGDVVELQNTFMEFANKNWQEIQTNLPWPIESCDHVITHNVSQITYTKLAQILKINEDKLLKGFDLFGNTASASIPLNYAYYRENDTIKDGDKILIIGLAAGINLSFQMLKS